VAILREIKGATREIGRKGCFVRAVHAFEIDQRFPDLIAIAIPIKNLSGKNGDQFSF
jgi:hypothetical protein